jgi:hypothetical protein
VFQIARLSLYFLFTFIIVLANFRLPLQAPPLSDHVREWMQLGASWLGGCCSYGPHDIADLRHFLQNQPDIELPGLQIF